MISKETTPVREWENRKWEKKEVVKERIGRGKWGGKHAHIKCWKEKRKDNEIPKRKRKKMFPDVVK